MAENDIAFSKWPEMTLTQNDLIELSRGSSLWRSLLYVKCWLLIWYVPCALRYSCSLLSQSLHFLVSVSTFVSHSLYQIICKCVKYILINPHFVPCKSAFSTLIYAFLRGRKCLLGLIYALKTTFPLNNVIKFGS